MPTYLVETIMRPGVLYEVDSAEYERLRDGNWLVGDPDRITPEALDEGLAAVVEDTQSLTRAAMRDMLSVGLSAYQLAVDAGFAGTEEEWLASLQGPANDLAIGTVTTGASDDPASATITGDSPAQTLNLTLPRGEKGDQGPPGAGAPDATATSKGSVQLAGDLGGTAAAPTVPALAGRLSDESLRAAHAAQSGRVNLVVDFGADPTGTEYVDTALQAGFDYLRANDGAVLYVPPGDYKLSRKADTDPTHGYSAAIFRGTVEGAGDASHFFLDPAATNPSRYYPIRIGTKDTATDGPVTFRRIKFTGNSAAIGGSSVMGLCAGHDAGDALLLHTDDVTVEHCTIVDTAVAIGCTKNPGLIPNGSTVLYHRNWRALHNKIRTTSNKAIELGHCDGGWIVGNDIADCFDGPQGIYYTRDLWIESNRVRYINSGINITHGTYRFWLLDNDVEALPAAGSGAAAMALFFRTEPQSGTTPAIRDGVVRGNRLSNTQAHTARRAVQFQTRTEVTSALYERILFDGNDFDGIAFLREASSPAKTTIRDMRWMANRFRRGVDTVAQTTCLVERMRFRDNEHDLATTINGAEFEFRDDIFTAGLTLSASSSAVRGEVQGTVTDSGTGNAVTSYPLL